MENKNLFKMKHLLINKAYFVASRVEKKIFSTALPIEKVKVHTISSSWKHLKCTFRK